MGVRHLYGDDGHVGGRRWEILLIENATDDDLRAWNKAVDILFPPLMPGEIPEGVVLNEGWEA